MARSRPTRYDRYLDAREDRLLGKPAADWLPPMQAALRDALYQAVRAREPVALAPEIAFELYQALADILRGHAPELLAPARGAKGGAPRRTLAEEGCQADAALYVRAVRGGRIADPRPIKTVVAAFGGAAARSAIDRTTVQKWVRAAPRDPRLATMRPQLIAALMRTSGAHWRRTFSRAARKQSR